MVVVGPVIDGMLLFLVERREGYGDKSKKNEKQKSSAF